MYKQTSSTTILRADGAFIPADPANTDYAVYLAWLAEGNTPEPADVPPAPSPLEQMRALESKYADAQARLNRQVALVVMLNTACSAPEAAGMTSAEVHDFLMTTQPDSVYAAIYTLEQQVAALRAQP